jgi:oxygen-independent coproporphyrinogen-3 oxidase
VHGIYVHVPFCVHRCHYCDFFTIAGRDQDREAYVDRLLDEAAAVIPYLPRGIETVFIGGGTPTHLPGPALAKLLAGLGTLLESGQHPVGEWTVEANPDTVTESVAQILAAGGVNRVSLGAQSFEVAALAALERRHNPAAVPIAMAHLRAAGIDDLSLDLIFGVPGQADPLPAWQRDLEAAVALQPMHLSCYGLTYEPGTPLKRRLEQGRVTRVDQEIEADQYVHTVTRLAEAGFEQYEISNWSKPGRRCQHNEAYWLNRNWWPLGPSGSGHVNGTRWRNVPRLGPWLAGTGLSAIDTLEQLDADGRAGEVLMLGLRRLDGVARPVVATACDTPKRGRERRAAIAKHVEGGLLAWTREHLHLTPKGLLLADGVMGDLL